MAIPSFTPTVVARAAAGLYGLQLGSGTMNSVLAEANMGGGINALIDGVYARDHASKSTDDVAAMVVANVGITGAGVADAVAHVKAVLDATPAEHRGSVIAEQLALFSGMESHPVYGSAASAFNGRIAAAVAYAQTAGTIDRPFNAGAALAMTMGQDFLSGTPGNDVIQARIFDNQNTWQSGDWADGGNGNDRIEADMGSSPNFSVTPETVNIEQIAVRAQAWPFDSTDNNVLTGRVQVDAERIVGATQFESNNSRADVIFEDVRILPSQITKDITVAWVESDPGHVDFGLYFDQYSLRNQVSNTSAINLQIMDTVAAAAGEAPLKNSNYGAFTFTATTNGVTRTITLGSQAIQDAQTYVEMAAAFQAALDAEFGPGVATATVGDNFTVVDPASKIAVTGQNIVLTTKTATTFSTPAGSGWLASGVAPPASNFYTNFFTGSTQSASLVTSTVILDDVGRGSTGGDLVIGGLSTGATSSSLGVQRFEIEVRDNSKLESINSTNNTLREVTIKNGATSNSGYAYVPTVKDAGNLTVNGNSGANGANISNSTTPAPGLPGLQGDAQAGANANLPGHAAQVARGFGFSDVRLLDASAMTGKFEFTAEVTSASLAKYLNLRDIQALPAGDNVHFTYTGGKNDDTMWVVLDSNAVASRNTIMVGREDFTFTANGGDGNDRITLFVPNAPLNGGDQHWYTNQKLNKNITIDGGAGNDTIRTPGAGDAIILGGTGNDTTYADNSGLQVINNGQANTAGAVYTASEAAELAAALALGRLQNDTDAAQLNQIVTDLNTLDLVTPVEWNPPVGGNPLLDAQPTRAAIQAAIEAALAAEALTPQQAIALAAAYGTRAAGSTITTPNTLVEPTVTWAAAVVTDLTQADWQAGNTLLASYIAAAKTAAADATGAEANFAAQLALLNATQEGVINATLAIEGLSTGNTVAEADVIGTATVLNAMTTLRSTLNTVQTAEAAVAAITAAWRAGAFGDPDVVPLGDPATLMDDIFAALVFPMTPAAQANLALIMDPVVNALTNANNAAQAALAAAIAANNAEVRADADAVGVNPSTLNDGDAEDAVGAAETAAARTAAQNALDDFTADIIDPLTTIQSTLASLKSALAVNTTELQAQILIDNAQFAINTAIADLAAAGFVLAPIDLTPVRTAAYGAAVEVAPAAIDIGEKQDVDREITALQFAHDTVLAVQLEVQDDLEADLTAATLAAAQAAAAAAASPGAGLTGTSNHRGTWVLNTANQQNVTTTPGTGYVLAVNDERNVNDLKSDANNIHQFFAATVTVTFKHLTATATVPNTGYLTSDLQINQAIKDAINNNAVLNKLITATDGPGNTLVITSQIDGVMSVDNLGIALTLPAASGLNSADVAGAAAAYGVANTSDAVLAAMAAAKTAFDTRGDYVDQLAESGAFAGNVRITGAASTTTSDNTITPGDGNDVTVLGTTANVEALLSSNDRVVFGSAFGNDTIVHFQAGPLATGGDVLVLSGLGGSLLGTAFNVDKSINVADETTANDTAAEIAALFTDSTTAQTHVYVAVDPVTNIGKVYAVVDAAGTGANSVTATLAGTIDLADTLWGTLTAENFG